MSDSIEVQLEKLRGDFKALNTVIRMHIAEQKAINAQNTKLSEMLIQKSEALDVRIDTLEKRQAYWYGAILGLIGLSQVLRPLLAKFLSI